MAEASSLGLPPGEMLREFKIDFEDTGDTVAFHLVSVDGEDQGWRYDSPSGLLHVLIIYD